MEVFNKNDLNINDNKPTGKKKAILIGIVVCVVLIIILIFLIMFYKELDAKTFKVFVDGEQVSCSSSFYYEDENGNMYVKAKELAEMIGWTYQNGEYGSYTEDTNSGYLQNEYEVSSFVADSKVLKKYIQAVENTTSNKKASEDEVQISVNSENGTLEIMELDLPVISINDSLYIPFSSINDICNCMGSYQNYRMKIYELNYLTNLALENAYSYGYESVSGTYENLRALAYGMMVVENTSGMYGVVTLSTNEQILGFKYTDMVFNQNVKEFFVKAEDTVGIVGVDGKVIISPKNYDDISVISDALGLYLIEKDNMYGVLNREGETVVYSEFDSIGLSDIDLYAFNYTSDDNKYLIYDNTIVVEKDGKYGFYNLNGENKLSVNFQGIGYVSDADKVAYEKISSSSSNKKSDQEKESGTSVVGDSVLTIDSQIDLDDGGIGAVKGIVVEQTNLTGEAAYGIYDAIQERLIIPCGCSRIYSTTKSGVTTYYMEFNGEQIEFEGYIKEQGLYTIIENNENNEDINLNEEER